MCTVAVTTCHQRHAIAVRRPKPKSCQHHNNAYEDQLAQHKSDKHLNYCHADRFVRYAHKNYDIERQY